MSRILSRQTVVFTHASFFYSSWLPIGSHSCLTTRTIFLLFQGSDGWQGGQACLPAAQLALEDVNKHPDLLRGYNLNLAAKDDMVTCTIELELCKCNRCIWFGLTI